MALANIEYIKPGHRPDQGLPGVEGPVDPGYGVDVGGRPSHPIVTPPMLPGVWPKPGEPSHPIYLPPSVWPGPGTPGHPIYIPIGPDNTLPPYIDNSLPEGPVVWPPLPPDSGLSGKVAILIVVFGYGYRWLVVDTDAKPAHPIAPGGGTKPPDGGKPPEPQPKFR